MALEIIEPRKRITNEYYGLEFSYDGGGGFLFDCDKEGQILEIGPFAKTNLTIAICDFLDGENTMAILTFNGNYTQDAVGRCKCGAEVTLYNDYGHGIDCPGGCGRIYSQLGSELNPRSMWEERYDEDSTQPYWAEFGYEDV